jgi:hypothetical protein
MFYRQRTLSKNSAGYEARGIYNAYSASARTVLNSNTPDSIFGLFAEGNGNIFR